MRNEIIKYSIESLQKNGLRFSVDDVAKSLKISKKTIYKFFATKEDLAIEIYNTYYEDAVKNIVQIKDSLTKEHILQIFTIYYQSHCMNRNEIFNKYALNENIYALAQMNHSCIREFIKNFLPKDDRTTLMIIIDGTLKYLCEHREEEKKVIERLVELVC